MLHFAPGLTMSNMGYRKNHGYDGKAQLLTGVASIFDLGGLVGPDICRDKGI